MLLKEISYYQTGGTCDEWISPSSTDELVAEIKRLHQEQVPYFLLGAGSNSLVMDGHWPGAVVRFNQMTGIDLKDNQITAQAGVENTQLPEYCLKAGLTGAEWMNYLPGQLGATVRMNARCYGGEISGIVKGIVTVTPRGEIRRYRDPSVFKGYKDTLFMTSGEIISSADILLSAGNPDQIEERMDFCRTDREKKHQFSHPSCGCVFKNDYTAGVPSGMLLDRAGVRAISAPDVEISPWHANFVFNRGASARRILETTLEMREAVYERFGVWLEFEMEILGLLPQDLKGRVEETREPELKLAELAPLRKQFMAQQR